MREIWIDVRDYEGLYQVSNYGRVKSLKYGKERILSQTPDSDGYLQVILYKDGVREKKKVHKLVAEAFLPNPNNYADVHHRNHINTDNRVENLERIDGHEHRAIHQNDRVEAAREVNSKTVYQYTKDGLLVNVWKSAREAARVLGFSQGNICNCCNGGYYYKGKWINRIQYMGYRWSYEPL